MTTQPTNPVKPVKVKYLEQSTIRAAIHASKATYNWYQEPHHKDFDVIVQSVSDVTPDAARAAFAEKAQKATRKLRATARNSKGTKLTARQLGEISIDASSYKVSDVVFRIATHEHVPDDPTASGARKKLGKVATNFPPFKHYICDDTGEVTEVGRSHWQGGLGNGYFSTTHGKTTNMLGKVYMLLVERYGRRGNWRGYSYNDEMQAEAIVTLCQNGMKFDETKGDNAFAYLSVLVQNTFTRVLNEQKKHQNIKDDILEMHGQTPSTSRQVQNELNPPPLPKPRKKTAKQIAEAEAKARVKAGLPAKKYKTHLIEINGEEKTLSEWARTVDISRATMSQRIKNGWTGEQLLAPAQPKAGRPRGSKNNPKETSLTPEGK